jgi:hypothetical protein
MNTDSILEILNAERNVLAKQLAALDQALNALGGRNGNPRKARRHLSAQARAKIIAAQKKRWAAWRKKQS